ncbi:hypothetical protein IPM09_02455 [Candidatus Saccharibacteria bacterium]|nr:MAG: hypothetical protein IPM09_02455 [Candidatus Saccharibacteria bacterium]
MAANAYWLLQRRDPGVAAKAGPEYADTSTLVGNVVGSMLTLGLGARALTKGTSLVRKYPTSRVGTAITTIGMVSAVDLGVESGRELYRRRETIMPGIKTLWSNLVPAQPQLSNKDIDRLLMEYYSRNAAQNPGPQDAKF